MNRRKTSLMLGAGLTMLVLAVGTAAAQRDTSTKAKPKSQTRIPVAKEPPRMMHDTVMVYRTDTVRVPGPARVRVDTVRVAGPTTTVVRYDTVRVEAPPPVIRIPGGLYFGVAGGSSEPTGALFTPNGMGYSVQGQLGWQSPSGVFGVRGDVNYTQPGEDSQFASNQGDPDIWNFSGDVKVGLPFVTRALGISPRFSLYGIGGVTYTMFKNLPMRIDGTTAAGNPLFITGSSDSQHQVGFNVGGGGSWQWGRSELFVESRLIAFDPDNTPVARQIPLVFGLNWYW